MEALSGSVEAVHDIITVLLEAAVADSPVGMVGAVVSVVEVLVGGVLVPVGGVLVGVVLEFPAKVVAMVEDESAEALPRLSKADTK